MIDPAGMPPAPVPAMRPFSRSLPMALLKAREVAMRGFRAVLSKHDLSEQQWRVIRVLNEDSHLETGELASLVFLLGPSLTRILQRLESRGLIARCRQELDQRKIDVSITPAGRDLFAAIAPLLEHEYHQIEAKLGREDTDRLMQMLARLTDILGDFYE